jgi:hypothetical protein
MSGSSDPRSVLRPVSPGARGPGRSRLPSRAGEVPRLPVRGRRTPRREALCSAFAVAGRGRMAGGGHRRPHRLAAAELDERRRSTRRAKAEERFAPRCRASSQSDGRAQLNPANLRVRFRPPLDGSGRDLSNPTNRRGWFQSPRWRWPQSSPANRGGPIPAALSMATAVRGEPTARCSRDRRLR